MGYYNNIFSATYNFYSRFKREEPRTSAICVLIVCQMLLIVMILAILQKAEIINVRQVGVNKYYFLPIIVLWFVFLFKYYSKEKVESIVQVFDRKTIAQKKVWGIISIISFLLPIILIAFLTVK